MSAKNPLISVTLPNYNYGRFLAESFEGILAQTYKHFEILFVDDGSTDESVEIARAFASRDPRIKPVYFEKNQGALPAHANAWSRATGSIIYQYSSDDAVCHPDFFRLGVEALNACRKAGGVFGATDMISAETGLLIDRMREVPIEGYINPAEFMHGFLKYSIFVPGISALWKKSEIDALGGYDYALGPQADYFINHAIPARHGVVHLKQLFAHTRVSPAKKSYSSNTNIEDEMKRLALFEHKMRATSSYLGNLDSDWSIWRKGQAKQLLQKYGQGIVAKAAATARPTP